MDLATIKDASIIVAGFVAFVTLWQGIAQYVKQGRFVRVNQFVEMRRRFMENESFTRILTLVISDCPDVAKEPILERRNLAAFFEELALMVNSGVLQAETVYYMFGRTALQLDDCPNFWQGLDKESRYWFVFRELVKDLRAFENTKPRKVSV